MIGIPAGEFLMGCDPWDSRSPCLDGEAPSHTVYLGSFEIDLTEVSNAQYALCVAHQACRPPDFSDADMQGAKYGKPEFSEYPITNITWYDARDYCAWVGKRLPSEAEWEKAARGDQDERFYPWGDSTPDCSLSNFQGFNGDCPGANSPVDDHTAGASPYGLLNMAGNVREWVADWYDANYYMVSPAGHPTGPDEGQERAIRGGSYNSDWIGIRVNQRGHNPPAFRAADLGFRCAGDN
jgi:formylglycine-generating enzyme required for sulfatase activity